MSLVHSHSHNSHSYSAKWWSRYEDSKSFGKREVGSMLLDNPTDEECLWVEGRDWSINITVIMIRYIDKPRANVTYQNKGTVVWPGCPRSQRTTSIWGSWDYCCPGLQCQHCVWGLGKGKYKASWWTVVMINQGLTNNRRKILQ